MGNPWEQRKCKELFGAIRNAFVGTATPYYVGREGHFYLESNNVKNGRINREAEVFINDEFYEMQKDKLLFEGDLVMVQSGHVGHTATIPKELNGTAAHALIMFQDKKADQINTEFLNQEFQTQNSILNLSTITTGNTIKHILASEMKEFIVSIPCIEEQKEISAFLQQIDSAIALHQRKVDLLKLKKKAYLQKMFPTQGRQIPEYRFAGFTEPWEQRKLGKLAEFNPKSELPDCFEYVDLESVVGTEMVAHRKEYKINAPSRAQRLAEQGDLFYQTVRPYQKNNYLFEKPNKDYVFSTGYAQMRPYQDGYFLLCLVQNEGFIKVVLDNCTGTSYPAINSNDLANITVCVPKDKSEQAIIGNFIRNLDNLITLHQRKLDLLKLKKKAYLQKMFPAKGENEPKWRFKEFA